MEEPVLKDPILDKLRDCNPGAHVKFNPKLKKWVLYYDPKPTWKNPKMPYSSEHPNLEFIQAIGAIFDGSLLICLVVFCY